MALILIQPGQVAESGGGGGVIRPQNLFPDSQGPFKQRQGLVVGAHTMIEHRQVVEADAGIGVLRAQGLFPDLQGPLVQGQGILVSPLAQ